MAANTSYVGLLVYNHNFSFPIAKRISQEICTGRLHDLELTTWASALLERCNTKDPKNLGCVRRNLSYLNSCIEFERKQAHAVKPFSPDSPFAASDMRIFPNSYSKIPAWGIYESEVQELKDTYEKLQKNILGVGHAFRCLVRHNITILLTRTTSRRLLNQIANAYDRIWFHEFSISQCHPPQKLRELYINLYLSRSCSFTQLPNGTKIPYERLLFYTIAHELTHGLHASRGTLVANVSKPPTVHPSYTNIEEQITICGLSEDGSYDPLCENQIQDEFNHPRRVYHTAPDADLPPMIVSDKQMFLENDSAFILTSIKEGREKEVDAFLNVNSHLKLSELFRCDNTFLEEMLIAALDNRSLNIFKRILLHEGISDYTTVLKIDLAKTSISNMLAHYFFRCIKYNDLLLIEDFMRINHAVCWQSVQYEREPFLLEALDHWLDATDYSYFGIVRRLQKMGLNLKEALKERTDLLTLWSNPERFCLLDNMDLDTLDLSKCNNKDKKGNPLLYYLCQPIIGIKDSLRLSIFRMLMKHTVDFSALDQFGDTALHRALEHFEYTDSPSIEDMEILNVIAEKGLNVPNSDGEPALFTALRKWDFRSIAYLLARPGINARFINKDGRTALHGLFKVFRYRKRSLEKGKVKVEDLCLLVKTLVQRFGVDFEAKDHDGKVFFEYIDDPAIRKEIIASLPL